MLRTGKLEESRTRCAPRRRPGHPFWKIDLIESDEGPQPAPQVFAVQMDPGSSLGTHFHFQDQFQLVIKGGGTIGRRPLQRFSLHYASGHTGYGPLVAGEGGMTYYTIRAITDGPGHYLPGAREEMQAVKKRNLHAEWAAPTQGGLHPLVPLQDNGAAAWAASLAPGECFHAQGDAGMRFYVVADGSVHVAGDVLQTLDCAFLSGEHHNTPLQAGDAGAQLVVLQFNQATP